MGCFIVIFIISVIVAINLFVFNPLNYNLSWNPYSINDYKAEWDKQTILYPESENSTETVFVKSASQFRIYIRQNDLISVSIKLNANWRDCKELITLWYSLPGRSENDYFLDIGANIGICSMNFLDRGIKTISIEPIPSNLNLYTKSLLLLNPQMLKNVILFPCGVGEKLAASEIKIRKGNWGGSSILEDKQNYLRFPIKISTLNVLLSKFKGTIHLACLDIEGYEYYALLGAREILQRKIVRHFHMELLCKNLILINKKEDDIYDIFEKNGYIVNNKKYCKKTSDAFNLLISLKLA